jgi:hypothetical protein
VEAPRAAWVIIRQDPSHPTEAQFVFYPFNPKEGVAWPEIKPIFEYPSERHPGELSSLRAKCLHEVSRIVRRELG